MMPAAKTKKVVKSAKDGKFVPKKNLTKKPKETYQQTVPVKKPKKK